MRARCGGGAAAGVVGVLAAPGTQGSWWLGSRKWQPVLGNKLQYSCLENPPDREAWQATVYRFAKSWTKDGQMEGAEMKDFFLPVTALSQEELSMKVAQLLGLQGSWWC